MRPAFKDLVGLSTVAVWIVSCLNGMITGDYQALQIVTPVALVVVTSLFAPSLLKRNGNGKLNGNGAHG